MWTDPNFISKSPVGVESLQWCLFSDTALESSAPGRQASFSERPLVTVLATQEAASFHCQVILGLECLLKWSPNLSPKNFPLLVSVLHEGDMDFPPRSQRHTHPLHSLGSREGCLPHLPWEAPQVGVRFEGLEVQSPGFRARQSRAQTQLYHFLAV